MADRELAVVIKANDKQIQTIEKNIEHRKELAGRRQALLTAIEAVDAEYAKFQGRADGLVSGLVGDKGYEYDEVYSYTYDTEKKHFVVLFIAPEEKAKLTLVEENGEEKILEPALSDTTPLA